MTEKRFLDTWHGMVVSVSRPFSTKKIEVMNSICEELGLKATELPNFSESSEVFSITNTDLVPNDWFNENLNEVLIPIDVDELFADYEKMKERLKITQATKVLDALASFNIDRVETKYIGIRQNIKRLMEDGFLQANTSKESSLWWNSDGRRIIFVRGEGVFEIVDKIVKQ